MALAIISFLGITAVPVAGLVLGSSELGLAEWTAIGVTISFAAFALSEFVSERVNPRQMHPTAPVARFSPIKHSHRQHVAHAA
jgi:hypothetical protein